MPRKTIKDLGTELIELKDNLEERLDSIEKELDISKPDLISLFCFKTARDIDKQSLFEDKLREVNEKDDKEYYNDNLKINCEYSKTCQLHRIYCLKCVHNKLREVS